MLIYKSIDTHLYRETYLDIKETVRVVDPRKRAGRV